MFFTCDYFQNVVITIIIVFYRNRCRTLRLYHANAEKMTTLPSLETDVPPWSAVFDPCGRLWCVQNDCEAPVIVFEPKGTGVDQTVCDVLKITSRCRNSETKGKLWWKDRIYHFTKIEYQTTWGSDIHHEKITKLTFWALNEFLVSKETVVLRRWERSKQKFGFIKRVDKGWITTVKDLESFLNLSRW